MVKLLSENLVKDVFALAGIEINGNRPWDIQISNQKFYKEMTQNPQLLLGETYMDKWWECEQLDQFFTKLCSIDYEQISQNLSTIVRLRFILTSLYAHLINLQSKSRAFMVGEKHYDLGNHFYSFMLDSRMIYSCGYWQNQFTLEAAQEAKLDLICRKLRLEPGMRLLDIGCGWGGLAKFAAERYGVSVYGVTISKEQQKYAAEICRDLPIQIELRDYRDINEKFDRISSVGMFEHVGFKNYVEYFETVARCLKPSGLFLLHTIGNNYSTPLANPWIRKYIFPNGMIPSVQQIGKASEHLLVMEDWHNFGADYDKTLMAWHANFVSNWDKIKHQYDEKFYRMWNFYLLSCAGSFRSRDMQLWQIVFSAPGSQNDYRSVR